MLRPCLALLLLLSACGGDDDDGGGDGAAVDAGEGGLADAAAADAAVAPDGGAPPDAGVVPDGGAPPDAGVVPDAGMLPDGGGAPDAAPSGMEIEAIIVDGDFTQARQGSEVDVLVTGSGLAGVTDVVLGEDLSLYPGTLVVSDDQVAFTMWVSDRTAPGPAELTLTGADGSATAAVPVTPWVVQAGAAPGGRGTYESPMSLCEEALAYASGGARVELSAGEHVCAGVNIGPVSEIVGLGVGQTIVRAGGFYVEGSASATLVLTVRDLRVIGAAPAPDAMVLGGSTDLLDVAVEGLGLVVQGVQNQVTMERVVIAGRAGADCVAVDRFASLSLTDVELSGCRHGVAFPRGNLEVAGATITGCEVGVFLGSPPVVPPEIDILNASLSEVELIDNQVGLRQIFGNATATDVAIHGSSMGPVLADAGVEIQRGDLEVTGLVMDGVRHGIDAHTLVSDDIDNHVGLTIDAALIEGGEVGLDVDGDVDGAGVWLTGSVVRDQTEAAVRLDAFNRDSSFFLTDDELSVTSGYALDDVRSDDAVPGAEPIDARGTTLNGNTYDGQLVQGPVAIGADLRIASEDASVQF